MKEIASSETIALKAQTPGDYPKDTIPHQPRRNFEIKINFILIG
jgi:hypothetical protein